MLPQCGFLSQSGSSANNKQRSPRSSSLEEGSAAESTVSSQYSTSSVDGSQKPEPANTDPKWAEGQPVTHLSEERRRNKYLRKDYLKYKCQAARRSFSGNGSECMEGKHSADVSTALTVFGLKPRSAFSRGSHQEYSATDPGFTIRRKMEHMREEMEQIQLLRQNLESRLKVLLPDDVGAALMDGVVLCHLANHIRPRSVASIHVPSPAVFFPFDSVFIVYLRLDFRSNQNQVSLEHPKLSMAKCRRNVENFLDACKKLGVPQDKLCLPHHILEERGLVKVGVTVQALLDLPASRPTQLSAV
ncbi:hypothetical protein AAFF_G00322130 [Aldrovandia affinis]|uniref:Calponin-homology (CH) domain-containing protein n=1 Tax=Aldrovandia affinis TaxID=143900 RepID=A0AAD7WQ67_9TELE|nr:hypothetical protein AAFF_G00322130 [Aldrovandia affinis]